MATIRQARGTLDISWEELAHEIAEEAERCPDTLRKMCVAGAEVLVEETRMQMDAQGVGSDGQGSGITKASIKAGPVKQDAGGCRIEVWPQGRRTDKRHPNGESNETIGFVIEHGKASIKAKPFMAAAAKSGESKVHRRMLEVWEAESGE